MHAYHDSTVSRHYLLLKLLSLWTITIHRLVVAHTWLWVLWRQGLYLICYCISSAWHFICHKGSIQYLFCCMHERRFEWLGSSFYPPISVSPKFVHRHTFSEQQSPKGQLQVSKPDFKYLKRKWRGSRSLLVNSSSHSLRLLKMFIKTTWTWAFCLL